MYLASENHARPGVSRESLWRRHSYELVVIGYNQQLLGTMVLDVVPIHLRALSLFVLYGSRSEGRGAYVAGLPEPPASPYLSTQDFQLAKKKIEPNAWSCVTNQ